ncbi:hypothetical protein [Brachybacterium sp. AOP3-A1-3]|uniref:hypothetical protein n=1 Tax=Brachybacterium sp. AOP3-A1-3 TaxID=3457699 RepID=UPI00403475A4
MTFRKLFSGILIFGNLALIGGVAALFDRRPATGQIASQSSTRPLKSTKWLAAAFLTTSALAAVGIFAGFHDGHEWMKIIIAYFAVGAAICKMVAIVAKNFATDEKHVSEGAAKNLTITSQLCDIFAALLVAPAIGSLLVKLNEVL